MGTRHNVLVQTRFTPYLEENGRAENDEINEAKDSPNKFFFQSPDLIKQHTSDDENYVWCEHDSKTWHGRGKLQ